MAEDEKDQYPSSPGETQEKTTEPLQRQKSATDEPPNGGYGWVCVACAALINAHTWGINSSYGVFLAYYLDNDTFPGATYLDFAFVGGLSISMALLVAPIATNVTRLFGTRTTLLTGVFFETVSLIGASFAKEIWHLFLSQGVCFGWGMGFLFVGSVGVPPQWFTTRRSLANGISAAGSGLGGLTYSLATNAIIKSISLGWAFRILGIVAGGVNIVCAILMKDRNKQIGGRQAAFDLELFLRLDYQLLLGWGFFSMLGYIVLLFSLPNYATSLGLTARQGSIVGAILNLGQACGRPPIGYFSDSFGRINMSMTMTFLSGLFALVIWTNAKSYGVLVFYALIGGTVAGTFWGTIAPVTAEVVGLKKLPTALSIIWLWLVLPCTFSEPTALEIAQRSEAKYLGTQLFTGFMYMTAALCLLGVRIIKIGKNEELEAEKRRTDADSDRSNELTAARPDGGRSKLIRRLIAWKKV
ncbi:MAG: hypothetical protein M1828_004507 [Chrysothrix sp. TS-e1954]|nr:MAG: hypothetical protein M1828_004507 [Chrysothrix sp. TS-e1954]